MQARRSFIAALVVALLAGGGYQFAAAQQGGGAFVPSFNYTITSLTGWIFSVAPTITGGGTVVGSTQTATLTNKTITAPVLGGTATGTYTLAGTPTITAPVLSGSATGTYTLAGTPTITSPTVTTPTITSGVSGSGTYTFPSSTGGIPIVVSCGVTSGSTDTCDNTATGATAKIFMGNAALLSGTGQTIVTGLSPAFTSTTTGACVGIDQSGASGVIAEVVLSGVSSLTVSGSGAGVVWWMCAGY